MEKELYCTPKSNFSDAIECYDVALKIKPRFAMALAYKGMSLGEIGELDYALTCFKKALTIDKYYDLANMGKQKALELLKSQNLKNRDVARRCSSFALFFMMLEKITVFDS